MIDAATTHGGTPGLSNTSCRVASGRTTGSATASRFGSGSRTQFRDASGRPAGGESTHGNRTMPTTRRDVSGRLTGTRRSWSAARHPSESRTRSFGVPEAGRLGRTNAARLPGSRNSTPEILCPTHHQRHPGRRGDARKVAIGNSVTEIACLKDVLCGARGRTEPGCKPGSWGRGWQSVVTCKARVDPTYCSDEHTSCIQHHHRKPDLQG